MHVIQTHTVLHASVWVWTCLLFLSRYKSTPCLILITSSAQLVALPTEPSFSDTAVEKAKFKITNSVCIVTSGNCYIREPNVSVSVYTLSFHAVCACLPSFRPAPFSVFPSPSQPADTVTSSTLSSVKKENV